VQRIEWEQRVGDQVHSFPPPATDLEAEVGGAYGEKQQVEGNRAQYVDQRLLGSIHGIYDIDHPEMRSAREQDERGMNQGHAECGVSGPTVQLDGVDSSVRPSSHRIVFRRKEKPDQDVEREQR